MSDLRLNPALNPRGLNAVLKQKASDELWERGNIRGFILDSLQQEIVAEFERSKSVKYVFLISRRVGKSYALVTLAIEKALQKPNQIIKYVTSTKASVHEMVSPLFQMILETCPDHVRPEYNINRAVWIFNNGSQILLHGVDKDKGSGLRGHACDFAIFDEAGFTDHLYKAANQVVLPMILERHGRMLLASTPPRETEHDFLRFIYEAEAKKAISRRVVYDCPRFSAKDIRAIEEEYGGADSEEFRVEFLCEIIRDSTKMIIPEFTDALEKDIVFSDYEELGYIPDKYVALDPGMVDNAAILYGFYDFIRDTLVISKEYLATGNNTEELAMEIRASEQSLWGGLPPYKRVSDIDLRLIKDLKDLHKIKFTPTEKDNKGAQINVLRVLFKQKRIKIHSSCVNLIQQCKFGQKKSTNSDRIEFARTKELGHCDAIDCLIYMVRNVNRNRNPIPEKQRDPHSYYATVNDKRQSKNARTMSKLFE